MSRFQWIGAGLGIALLIIFMVLPPMAPLTSLGMKTIGVFLSTICFWVVIDTAFSSLLCIALLAITGVLTPNEAFSASLGSWLPMFLIACFGLSEALRITGFSRRFAFWFLTRPFAKGHPWLLISLLFLGIAALGAIMSSTVTTILFLAIVVSFLEGMGYQKGDRFAAMMVMGIAWAATASFVMTPVGHGGNLVVMEWIRRDIGFNITFTNWMVVGIPMGLISYLVLLLFFRFVVRPDVKKFTAMVDSYISREASQIKAMQTGEKFAVGVFGVVFVVWMLPSVISGILPEVSAYFDKLGMVVPPLVGAIVLCMIRVRNKPLMSFREWMSGVEWGTVMLVAAIMAIGVVIGKPETGIVELMTGILQPLAIGAPFLVVVLVSVGWVVLQTNLMSNLVSATVVYTVMIPTVINAAVGNPVALGFTIFAGSNLAFVLPSATTSTAIVIGSGWIPVKFMAKYGVILIIPMILLFAFVCYPLANLIFR
jgi:solute carrier family 13 (sodium-dependent dicarboxylate transporter), member 2/3/5